MTVKNVVIGTEPKIRKPREKKIKQENPEILKNESFDYFMGKNLDDGTDPVDELLAGVKITYKKKWLVWLTNHNKNGKVMSDKEAFESSENIGDDFFGRAYRKSEFICRNKRTQVVEFQDNDFYKFCDFLNVLK